MPRRSGSCDKTGTQTGNKGQGTRDKGQGTRAMEMALKVQVVRVVTSLIVAVGVALPAAAQEPQQTVVERYTAPIDIYKTGLGTFARPISSTNKEAHAFFNQGIQMMWSFAKPEAVRSFRESWKRDPNCAICYWGEAWAWGSYLNAPMSMEEAPYAYAAIQKAVALKSHASEEERAFIDAMSRRYVEHF